MKSTLCLDLCSFFLSHKTTLLNLLLTKLPLSRLLKPGRLIYTGSTLVTMNIQPRKNSVAKLPPLVTYRDYVYIQCIQLFFLKFHVIVCFVCIVLQTFVPQGNCSLLQQFLCGFRILSIIFNKNVLLYQQIPQIEELFLIKNVVLSSVLYKSWKQNIVFIEMLFKPKF